MKSSNIIYIYPIYIRCIFETNIWFFLYLYIYIHMHSNVEHTSPILKKVQPWNHQVMIVFRIRWILWSRTSKHLEHQGKFILKDKHVTCIESSNHLCVCVVFCSVAKSGNVVSWTCWSNLKHSMFEAKDLQQLVPWSKGEGRNHGWLPGYISA